MRGGGLRCCAACVAARGRTASQLLCRNIRGAEGGQRSAEHCATEGGPATKRRTGSRKPRPSRPFAFGLRDWRIDCYPRDAHSRSVPRTRGSDDLRRGTARG